MVSGLAAWAFSSFLTKRMIHQDAENTAGFVRSLVATENAYAHFFGDQGASGQQQQFFIDHLTRLPSVLRTNVYSADRVVIWSSDPALVGKRFDHNHELEEALRADLVIHSGIIDPDHLPKVEHQHLATRGNHFVENYVPIFDIHGRNVVGVVELYKIPHELFEAIDAGVKMIWLAAGVAGLFLYLTLFWVIRRAQQIIEAQGDQLIESESLAIVGEMGSAVAHGLRNPLASIRSSAELSLESTSPAESKECAEDIIAQVDRLDVWVKQLLTYAKPAHAQLASVDINQVLRMGVENYSRELERNAISIDWRLAENLPAIRGDAVLLAQLVSSLIANAIDAMGKQGALTITSRLGSDGMVAAEVRDNGSGISQKDVGMIFKPFYTTKTKGLGLGLPLVRRVIERFGGSVELDSTPGEGTQVRLLLPVWR